MANSKPFSFHRLPSGTRVILVPRHETDAVTLFTIFGVGSRYETPDVNGVSHFVEHLMFKGTKKRPTTLHISKELDGVGAEYNAFTSKDHTAYYIKVQSHRLPLAVDVMADMLRNSTFDPKEVDRERKVIVEEINMYEDNPLYSIEDLFETALLGAEHPLGWDVIGTREVIRGVSRAKIVRYRNQHYAPNTATVVVAGRFDETAVLPLLAKHFTGSRRARIQTPKPYRAYPAKLRIAVRVKKTEQVQLGLGFPGLPYGHRDLPALQLLATALGGSMSSRLFIQIRERLGLCYSVRAQTTVYADAGVLYVQAGLDRSRLDLAIRAILKELRAVRSTGLKPAELLRAKDYLRGKLVLDLEDSESLANFYGRQFVMTGKLETPQEKLKKFDRVTAADIRRVVKATIDPSRMAVAAIGPDLDRAHLATVAKG